MALKTGKFNKTAPRITIIFGDAILPCFTINNAIAETVQPNSPKLATQAANSLKLATRPGRPMMRRRPEAFANGKCGGDDPNCISPKKPNLFKPAPYS